MGTSLLIELLCCVQSLGLGLCAALWMESICFPTGVQIQSCQVFSCHVALIGWLACGLLAFSCCIPGFDSDGAFAKELNSSSSWALAFGAGIWEREWDMLVWHICVCEICRPRLQHAETRGLSETLQLWQLLIYVRGSQFDLSGPFLIKEPEKYKRQI